eukprot:TRINITY_DN3434_c5_g1_i1.p1 TRINITY_DN3434_c5_g1~~TRINITY_DN3434_c5_g1_i1.p1  ORF type:complete len:793 (-),score=97.14 TRINITY_DN3434_c5_g1_i1:407-2785(-)
MVWKIALDLDTERQQSWLICTTDPRYWRERCALFFQPALCMLVASVTVLLWLTPFLFYDGAPFTRPCNDRAYEWTAHMVIIFMVGAMATCVISVVMLIRAKSMQFRCVKGHVTLIWLSVILWSFFFVDSCTFHDSERKGRGYFHVVCLVSVCVNIASVPALVLDRILVLQKSMFRNVGADLARLVFRGTIFSVISFVIASALKTSRGSDAYLTPYSELVTVAIVMFQCSMLFLYYVVVRALAMAWYHSKQAQKAVARAAQESYILNSDTSPKASAETVQVDATAMIASAATQQLLGTAVQVISSLAVCNYGALRTLVIWPLGALDLGSKSDVDLSAYCILIVDFLINSFCTMLCSGVLAGSVRLSYIVEASNRYKVKRRKQAMQGYQKSEDDLWQQKVEEMSGRGFTLEALLDFYKTLGTEDCMPHFQSHRHTTSDVVRQAIIPSSKQTQSSLAEVMMKGVPTYPGKMVTHNWGNIFRDLVAAIIADALNEDEFCKVAFFLDNDLEALYMWLKHGELLHASYWVCAFSVSQHDGICGSNPYEDKDSVTGLLHPVCLCGKAKSFNSTEPTLPDGRSISCEMNKFDDMIAFLAAKDENFGQVVAVDTAFILFSRAWCVAELAISYNMGMTQHVVVHSVKRLVEKQDSLRHLKVQEMKATRPEDTEEILSKIPDKEEFNRQLQKLIFGNLLAKWSTLDVSQRLQKVGMTARWQHRGREQGVAHEMWTCCFSTGSAETHHLKTEELIAATTAAATVASTESAAASNNVVLEVKIEMDSAISSTNAVIEEDATKLSL